MDNHEVLLINKYFSVIEDNGYFIVKEPKEVNGVVIIPRLGDGRLMLVTLARRAIGADSVEFPRGAIDDNESEIEAALRELKEETGWTHRSARVLGYLHSNTSILASKVAVFLIDLDGCVTSTDGEIDSLRFVSLDEIKKMISSGMITDGHTLSSLAMLSAIS